MISRKNIDVVLDNNREFSPREVGDNGSQRKRSKMIANKQGKLCELC
jgi:hypothetical protein